MTNHRVLVVEDDHGLRDVLARGLREEQFDVFTAADGAAALHVVRDRAVDAVVLEVGARLRAQAMASTRSPTSARATVLKARTRS